MSARTVTMRRDRAVPLYRQLLAHLREQIRAGALAPGDPLPSESQLQERFGVSRITVRNALRELQREGLLLTKQGKGSFVLGGAVAHELGEFHTLSEVLREHGYPREVDLLFHGDVTPPDRVAADLGLEGNATCVLVKRRHLMKGEPVALTVMYLPKWFANEWRPRDFVDKTVYELASERSLGSVEGRRILTAASASEEVAGTLGMSIGDPVITVVSRSRVARGGTFESSVFYFHPRRYSFRFHFSRGAGASHGFDSSGVDF